MNELKLAVGSGSQVGSAEAEINVSPVAPRP